MQKQNLCQGDFMPKNGQHYRKIKYPDKVTKQNALYLSGYFYLVLWEVEMLISRQPLKIKKSARRDSNPRPRPWQGRTPPTEPLAHTLIISIQ